ncbi:MAG: hypothetical protein O2805_10715 [Proteobacteria bacterium]|nr:hypothetical protein [Pseudomonadota bacterium]
MISADRLQIISNKNLRRQLAGWESVLDEVRDDQSRDSDFAFNRVVPFLIQHGISTGHGANSQYGDWPVPTESIAADAEILTQLLADPEFRALLDIRLADLYHTQQEFVLAMQAADEILNEIASYSAQISSTH